MTRTLYATAAIAGTLAAIHATLLRYCSTPHHSTPTETLYPGGQGGSFPRPRPVGAMTPNP